MDQKPVSSQKINEIMRLRSQGLKYSEIGEKVGKSPKTVEGVVVRHRHYWCRDFNFPEIMHKKRFGAK